MILKRMLPNVEDFDRQPMHRGTVHRLTCANGQFEVVAVPIFRIVPPMGIVLLDVFVVCGWWCFYVADVIEGHDYLKHHPRAFEKHWHCHANLQNNPWN